MDLSRLRKPGLKNPSMVEAAGVVKKQTTSA
jgi:hypothetical protein